MVAQRRSAAGYGGESALDPGGRSVIAADAFTLARGRRRATRREGSDTRCDEQRRTHVDYFTLLEGALNEYSVVPPPSSFPPHTSQPPEVSGA